MLASMYLLALVDLLREAWNGSIGKGVACSWVEPSFSANPLTVQAG